MLCVHKPASSLCSTTVDHTGIMLSLCGYHAYQPIVTSVSRNYNAYLHISYSVSTLVILVNKPLVDMLNSTVASCDSPCLIGVDLIWNKAKLTSLLLSKHFFMVHFMPASTYLLLWWLYDEDTGNFQFSKEFLKLSEINLCQHLSLFFLTFHALQILFYSFQSDDWPTSSQSFSLSGTCWDNLKHASDSYY